MNRREQRAQKRKVNQRRRAIQRRQNKFFLQALVDWFISSGELFPKDVIHGNVKWKAEEVAVQALIWSWQESRGVTDAFVTALEICGKLGLKHICRTYTGFMNTLQTYAGMFQRGLCQRLQTLAEEIGDRFWRHQGWVLMAFDGSRSTAPRTASNEKALCAENYGHGKTARYRKKKSKGMRRRKNEKNKPQPQEPQVWITMFWHMTLRLPWAWRLGPSNSSERGHVLTMLQEEKIPKSTLFCGDAGFVGYDFWKGILNSGGHFLVRVGANVSLLSQHTDIQEIKDGIVLCWPKDKMNSGSPPLRLRLVRIKIGNARMWMLTSVLSKDQLSSQMIAHYYKLRWGIEVEYRGLKQTIDKGKLRCRNPQRVYVELDWSIRAMAVAELFALKQQIPQGKPKPKRDYDPKDRSLACTVRALRHCMRNLSERPGHGADLLSQLRRAQVQKYTNHTSKKPRYRPKNPDKQPLGNPQIRKLASKERAKLQTLGARIAA